MQVGDMSLATLNDSHAHYVGGSPSMSMLTFQKKSLATRRWYAKYTQMAAWMLEEYL
jgi:hypothetical protein